MRVAIDKKILVGKWYVVKHSLTGATVTERTVINGERRRNRIG